MTAPFAPRGTVAPAACPFLGLQDDPATHLEFPSAAQLCHAGDRPARLAASTQANLCLTTSHPDCAVYRRRVGSPEQAVPRPVPAEPVAPLPSLERVSAPTVPVETPPRPARGRRLARTVAYLALFALVAGAGVVIGIGAAGPLRAVIGGAQPSLAVPSTRATSRPTTAPAVAPVATSSPAATTAPSPSPSPSPRPTVSPPATPPPVTHVVQRGENLTRIAERYGVTTAAIQAANGIDDPNVIVVGQTLLIPRP